MEKIPWRMTANFPREGTAGRMAVILYDEAGEAYEGLTLDGQRCEWKPIAGGSPIKQWTSIDDEVA